VCNVLVFVMGEESFADGSNGFPVNGIYDFGETFVDTADDPWRDYDDDGLWDAGNATTPSSPAGPPFNPMEDGYQDRLGNSIWNGLNGVWDGPHPNPVYQTKNIYRQVDFLITGLPYIRFDKTSFTVADGASDTVRILICDQNYNPLATGSTYTVSVDVGKITGGTSSYEYPSSSFYGSETNIDWDGGGIGNSDYIAAHRDLIENVIVISDDDPGDTDPPELSQLKVTVTWKSGSNGCADVVKALAINGTVD